jgi:hypothetical protein
MQDNQAPRSAMALITTAMGSRTRDLGTTTVVLESAKTRPQRVNGQEVNAAGQIQAPRLRRIPDNDCDGLVEDLGTTTCNAGECEETVHNGVNGLEVAVCRRTRYRGLRWT